MKRYLVLPLWLGAATMAMYAQTPHQPVPIGGPYPENAATEGAGRRGRGGRRGMPPT